MLFVLVLSSLLQLGYSSQCLDNVQPPNWVVASGGKIPSNAIYGGYDRDRYMFICAVTNENGTIVGKIQETDTVCYYAAHNKEVKVENYKVPTQIEGVWVPIDKPHFPCNRYQFSTYEKQAVYSARAYVDNTLTLGSLRGDHQASIPYGYYEFFEDKFELFTATPLDLQVVAGASKPYTTVGKYLTFKVKSDDEVAVYLGIRRANRFCINIGIKNTTAIGSVETPYNTITKTDTALNGNVFKGFWIRWTTRTFLEFGREGDFIPLLTYNNDHIFKIDSVVFTSKESSDWLIPSLNIAE